MNLLFKKNKQDNALGHHHHQAHLLFRDAYFDWVVIFVTSVATSLILIGVSIYIYFSTNEDLSRPAKVEPTNSVPTLDIKNLSGVISEFDQRVVDRVSLPKKPVDIADPSL